MGKVFAVIMSGKNDAPCSVRILRRNDVCELFGSYRCRVREFVEFYVPFEGLERRDNVLSHESVVLGVGLSR